jgi:hypothetical protein
MKFRDMLKKFRDILMKFRDILIIYRISHYGLLAHLALNGTVRSCRDETARGVSSM